MAYKTTPFGDGVSTTIVETVSNHFGPRTTGGSVGIYDTDGATREMVIDLDAAMVSAADFKLKTPVKLPAGAIVGNVFLKVKTAFALGGTTPTILIGTDGSEVTNGFVISEARAEAVGTYSLTSTKTGTWANPLAAATTLGIALGGTSPTVGTAGKAKLVIEYVVVGA